MFTTGSKALISTTVVSLGLAVAYGLIAGGALGTIGLIAAVVGLLILAAVFISLRDASVSAMDHDALTHSAAGQATARPSLWPLLAALGVLLVAYGLVSDVAFVLVGTVLLIATGFEWAVQAWSERVSVDPRYNSAARESIADPLEIPVAGVLLGGVVAFGFSRVMLGLPSKTATIVAFVVVATIVLLAGFLFAFRRTMSRTAVVSSFAIGVVALGTAGIAYGIDGPREIERHKTTADLAEENKCGNEETHADEKASQSVAAKSAITADVFYDGSSLVATEPGFDGTTEHLTMYRTNPNNLIFHNDSDTPARLVIDLHPPADNAEAVEPAPERACTALVEPGGVQFLTLYFRRNTYAVEAEFGEGYAFTVAGSDASLEVTVP